MKRAFLNGFLTAIVAGLTAFCFVAANSGFAYLSVNLATGKLIGARPAVTVLHADGTQTFYQLTSTVTATTRGAALAAAVAALAEGEKATVAPGDFQVTSTAALTVHHSRIVIDGAGWGTKILASGNYGDIVFIKPDVDPSTTPANAIIGVELRNLWIESATLRTNGYAVHARYVQDFKMDNVRIGTQEGQFGATLNVYNGVYLDGQDAAEISRCAIFANHVGVTVVGRSITWGTVNSVSQDLPNFAWNGHISATRIWGSSAPKYAVGSIGLLIAGGTGGFEIDAQTSIGYQETGIRVDKSIINVTNRELFLNNSYGGDDIGQNGLSVAVGSLTKLQIINAWFAGCGRSNAADAVNISDGSTTATTIVGGAITENESGYGVYVGGGTLTISGVTMYSNGDGDTRQTDLALGPNVTTAVVSGCTFAEGVTNGSAITPIVSGATGVGATFIHAADSAVANDSTYYSTNLNKLAYKDSSGSVHALY